MAKEPEKTQDNDTPLTGLDLLRKPFEPHQISKLPKPTKKQTDEVKADFKKGIRCKVCGGWHHPDVVHLDYVGHAALTDRLLDCDLEWGWEPVNVGPNGEPIMDENGGMWIRLTVCGVTRMGYGHPDGKRGGDAIKETIGDCLRNAAMRFGAALDLWHKGALHDDASDDSDETSEQPANISKDTTARAVYTQAQHDIRKANSKQKLKAIWEVCDWASIPKDWQGDLVREKDDRLADMNKPQVDHSAQQSLDDQFPGDLPADDDGYTAADYINAG